MFVVDASIVLSLILPDESNLRSAMLIERIKTEGAIAPSFLILELSNSLVSAFKQKRMTKEDIAECIHLFHQLSIQLVDIREFLALELITVSALDHNLNSYDTTYLDLAIAKNVRLATLDTTLIAAAERVGIKVI